MGSNLASWLTMLLFVSDVWPVAILAIEFWMVWRWLKLVSEIIGDHVVDEYSIIGKVIVL